MTQRLQVGTILIEDRPLMTRALDIECEPYGGNWSRVRSLNGFGLDRKIRAAGWNFFFIADELKAKFLGSVSENKVRKALMRILARMRGQNFNCLEVTGITAKHFAGVRYTIVTAHRRHIQESSRLEGGQQRGTQQKAAEWARLMTTRTFAGAGEGASRPFNV